jgi:hypothetical protein
MQRVLLDSPATIQVTYESDPGVVTADIYQSDGTLLASQSTGGTGTTRTTTLTSAQTASVDRLRVVWDSPELGQRITYVQVAGSLQPTAFITAQEVVDYLGRGEADDPGVVFAVDSACDVCRTIAEQAFSQGFSDTVILDGTGTDAMLLPELPVLAVTSVMEDTTAVTEYSLNGNGVLYRGAAGVDPRPVWPKGRQNITVTYDHGYDDYDFPDDIRMVALSIASRLVVQGAAAEESVGDVRVKYSVAASDLTANEIRILKKYRQVR